jgi:hypothetical protein
MKAPNIAMLIVWKPYANDFWMRFQRRKSWQLPTKLSYQDGVCEVRRAIDALVAEKAVKLELIDR